MTTVAVIEEKDADGEIGHIYAEIAVAVSAANGCEYCVSAHTGVRAKR